MLASVKFVDAVDIAGKDTADIGCGFGSFVLHMLEQQAKSVTGLEITEKDISTARKYIDGDRATFHVGSAIDIPLESCSLDTIVSWEVLEHIPKGTENQMFSEISRVLRSGGVFYLSTPHKSFWSCVADPAWLLIGHRHYSKQQLLFYAEKAGLKVDKLEVRGRFWVLAASLNMYFSKWVLRRKPIFGKSFAKKDTREYLKPGFVTIFMKLHKYI